MTDPTGPRPLMVLAGPHRSGTGDDPGRIAANHRRIQQARLELFRAGHLAVNGEDLALPLAGFRLPGPSAGSDEMVEIARAQGATIRTDVAQVPPAGSAAGVRATP